MSSNPILILERSFYIGSYMSGILYGVGLVMYFASMHFLLSNRDRDRKGTNWFYIVYSTVLIALLTIDISCNAVFGQLTWIDARSPELPPEEYFLAHITDWYNTMGTVSSVALNFLGDALLVYRLYIIWNSSLLIIAFPILLYFGALSMAILEVYQGAAPGANIFTKSAVQFGTPYYSMTIALNVFVTTLIVWKLLAMKRLIETTLTPQFAKTYTSVAALLIESAAPFSLLGIAYIIPYARGSQTAILFAQLWGKFTCLSPQFIVLRVAMGKAWSREAASRFNNGTQSKVSTGFIVASRTDATTTRRGDDLAESDYGLKDFGKSSEYGLKELHKDSDHLHTYPTRKDSHSSLNGEHEQEPTSAVTLRNSLSFAV